MGALGILVWCITPIGLTKHVSDKRPETDADILSRSTELSYDFATGARHPGRRYHHDLVGHMAECDMNFQRLMQLFPHGTAGRFQVRDLATRRSRYPSRAERC